jgi:hypothetical protein
MVGRREIHGPRLDRLFVLGLDDRQRAFGAKMFTSRLGR